jgi:hypothetical protein
MKRAQSVEVLSILTAESPQAVVRRKEVGGGVLPASFFAVEAALSPPSELPPPLPPRDKQHSTVAAVLGSTPALVNDSLTIVDRAGAPVIGGIKAAATATVAPPSKSPPVRLPAAAAAVHGAKKPMQKRPSAGVLFGIKDKELPAPDTVKEVRKLFEVNALGDGIGRAGSGLIKSRSTSSLYTRPASRSESMEKLTTTTAGARKKSEEDLLLLQSRHGGRRMAAAASPRQPAKNGRSPSPRIASSGYSPRRSPSSSSSTSSAASTKHQGRRDQVSSSSYASSPTATAGFGSSRPVIPAKPSHLSPIVVGRSQAAAGTAFKSAILDRHHSGGGGRPATQQPVNKELDAVRLNLHPIASNNKIVSASASTHSTAVNGGAGAATGGRAAGHRAEADIPEEGVKRISAAAIQNIRKEAANVVNFNFHETAAPATGAKSHLPGVPAEYRPPQTAKQACSNPPVNFLSCSRFYFSFIFD